MPITLTILATDPETIPRIEVTIPDKCPNPECGADFSQEGAVVEEQFQYATQPLCFSPDGDARWLGSEVAWEGDMPVGHRCAKCNEKLTGHGLPSPPRKKG